MTIEDSPDREEPARASSLRTTGNGPGSYLPFDNPLYNARPSPAGPRYSPERAAAAPRPSPGPLYDPMLGAMEGTLARRAQSSALNGHTPSAAAHSALAHTTSEASKAQPAPVSVTLTSGLSAGAGGRAVFKDPPPCFVVKETPWDHQSPAVTNHQPPSATNHQPPTANHHQPLPTAANRHPLFNTVSVVLCLAHVLLMKQRASP